jgi:hypothetical protein
MDQDTPWTAGDVVRTLERLIGFVVDELEKGKDALRDLEGVAGEAGKNLHDLRVVLRKTPRILAELGPWLEQCEDPRVFENLSKLLVSTCLLGAMIHYSPQAVAEIEAVVPWRAQVRNSVRAAKRRASLMTAIKLASERSGHELTAKNAQFFHEMIATEDEAEGKEAPSIWQINEVIRKATSDTT